MIESLQNKSKDAVNLMQESINNTERSVEQNTLVDDALSSLEKSARNINEANLQISSAANQQSSVIEEANKSLGMIGDAAEHSLESARQTEQASTELAELADGLKLLAVKFKCT